MSKNSSDFKEMLKAMMDSRVVVLSLLDQLNLHVFKSVN